MYINLNVNPELVESRFDITQFYRRLTRAIESNKEKYTILTHAPSFKQNYGQTPKAIRTPIALKIKGPFIIINTCSILGTTGAYLVHFAFCIAVR